ncbi:hypothetical protein [Bdellovibrio sp. NC01]|uniref:hypothetical protein n=1 Tax=Bdellovibrio sp. NC01 TaxID=2220073 RepID=UPI00115BC81F|nr:hypothetical protein [Bdellovibrio sp. NC01]QDK37934.1 hypothetical protein DOE51_10225 [Bdellovibrio sp. NC01]
MKDKYVFSYRTIAPTVSDYFLINLRRNKLLTWKVVLLYIVSFSCLCLLSRAISKQFNISLYDVGFALVLSMVSVVLMFFVLYIIFGLSLQKAHWTFLKDRIEIRSLTGTAGYSYSDITQIVMEAPYLAFIYIQPKGRFLVTPCWLGNAEEEWLEFISFLEVRCPGVSEKIFVKTFKGLKQSHEKKTPAEAYQYWKAQ